MAFVSTDEIQTPALMVSSQSSVDGATPQLAAIKLTDAEIIWLVKYILAKGISVF